ncbi:hypothetical protein PR048_007633 [Dryococelus australis]|uniref:Mutator-like transposase domain-containing protein n=1 Tax=Dryococelus australis TaxID=614101 RepID=A0ABQ9HUW3_9NEOP|nr:hypothetical protein PR048_007633 [Dryococelus australis]
MMIMHITFKQTSWRHGLFIYGYGFCKRESVWISLCMIFKCSYTSDSRRIFQLREFSAGVDMHFMSIKTFLKHMKKVSEAIDDAALQFMLDAAEEEKAIAIRDGNVDSDGVPMCTVVADGAWCKCSYKTNYNSLSGVASIVGFKTGKVLYIRVSNRYCSLCASCQNAKQTPLSHMCFLDWKKSATSMESDIVADGFLQSEKLLGLKFNKLIGEILIFVLMLTGDGDSYVHRKLLETMPHGPNPMVGKVECKNHVLRNYCHKLTDLTKNTKFPVTSRSLSKQQIPRLRTAVDKAIKY